jgi:hypothetical protein
VCGTVDGNIKVIFYKNLLNMLQLYSLLNGYLKKKISVPEEIRALYFLEKQPKLPNFVGKFVKDSLLLVPGLKGHIYIVDIHSGSTLLTRKR